MSFNIYPPSNRLPLWTVPTCDLELRVVAPGRVNMQRNQEPRRGRICILEPPQRGHVKFPQWGCVHRSSFPVLSLGSHFQALRIFLLNRVREKLQQLLAQDKAWESFVAEVNLPREEAVVLREYLDQPDRKRFLEEFPQIKGELEKSINKLCELADNADKMHRDCTISNVVASSISIASGFLTILGLVLAPFTVGVRLGLSATRLGLGAAAAVTGMSTSIVELINMSSVGAQLDFCSIAQKISSEKSLQSERF
ncbi:hypothetical protein K5549_002739 [Capra hircus]|uniref:Apolipoprotein L3 n=1 Tax=Capra hircus TaxID=9925 RepID=A0A452EAQ7_CAPHI|nr:hypothetical protein K5549_002739 [Capra hircus]